MIWKYGYTDADWIPAMRKSSSRKVYSFSFTRDFLNVAMTLLNSLPGIRHIQTTRNTAAAKKISFIYHSASTRNTAARISRANTP